ncbi:Beta-glucosidase 11 [Linum grandiflorum]
MMMFVILKQLLLLLLLMVAASSELGILADDENDMGAPITTDPCLDSDYIEGAHDFANGKGPSVWDRFTHEFPDRILEGGNGDMSINHYHLYRVCIYVNCDGRETIRQPIFCWSTSGRRSDGVNQRGINFYHRLLDLLIENGNIPDRDGKYIGPHVCMSKKDNSSKTLAEALKDEGRINFYNLHLANVLRAMKEEQVKVKGFFTWSYADNFEWNEGYTVRFGLYYINYTDRSRHPKDTACWYTNFCKKTQPKSLKHFDFDHHKLINTTPATSLAAL